MREQGNGQKEGVEHGVGWGHRRGGGEGEDLGGGVKGGMEDTQEAGVD